MSKTAKSQGGVGLKLKRENNPTAPKRKKQRGKFYVGTGSGLKADTTGRGLRTEERTTLKGLQTVQQTVHLPDKQTDQELRQQTDFRSQIPSKGTAKASSPRQKLYFNARTGQTTNRLRFHETTNSPVKQAAGGALRLADRTTPGGGDNVDPSRESLRVTETSARSTVYHAASGSKKLHQRSKLRNASQKAKGTGDPLTPDPASSLSPSYPAANPASRRIQKKNIQKQYAAARHGRAANVPGPNLTSQSARAGTGAARRGSKIASKGKEILRYAKKKLIGVVALIAAIVFLPALLLPSCGMLMGGGSGIIESTTYQPEDDAMYAAEAAYCEMEADLQQRLDNYEAEHNYDEYHFELDSIEHDPYVLISMLCAAHPGAWTLEDVMPTLESLFAMQYTLTETVIEEERETDPAPTDPTDPAPTNPPSPRPPGPTPQPQSQDSTTDDGSETSTYKICTVTLKNFNLSHIPVYIFSQKQLEAYSMYMACLGNREDLFPDSAYIGRYGEGSYMDYAIPTEALDDAVFAAMMTEARKYLGYPYVWGGSSPQTSFDCSGFVSWVINHTVVDGEPYWGNIGRLGATGLYSYCTPTSTPHPGDLVFFENTYTANPQPLCTHVGIYVGVNPENGHRMMIHCGDPISFADLSSSYWVEHLYGYGHIPDPK